MGGGIPIGSSIVGALVKDAGRTSAVSSDNSAESLFNDAKLIKPDMTTSSGNATVTAQPAQNASTAGEPAFKTELKAFSKLNLPENAVPQKEINGISIYSTGGKEKITTTKLDGQMVISFGENGQKIKIPLGQMQPKGATVVYNGGALAVSGLKDATVVGRKSTEILNSSVNNQILAKNCNGCTFDMNDKGNGLNESRDDLVMDNCKTAKVLTGQNNAIVGLNGTNADVAYSSVVGKAAYDNPLKDWINKFHTNVAYDDTSSVSRSNKGSVNREADDPLVRDVVKKQGLTQAENSYRANDGSLVSAADLLLNVINDDSQNASNGSKSMFSEDLDSKASKLKSGEMLSQIDKIINNRQ